MQSNVKTCNMLEFSHIPSMPATKAPNFLQYLLVDQLHTKEMYFYFVTKCNQAFTKYLLDVFNSFYRTATHTHGEFHGIFTSSPPLFPSPSPRWNTPSKVHAVSTNPDVLPSPSFNGIKGLTEF